MKKLMVVLLGITLVLSMLVGGVFAYLTAEAENMDNTISTGSMCLGTDPEPFMQLTDMMPGGPAQDCTVTVFSNKPTKFFYNIQAVRQTGTSTKLWNAAMIEAVDATSGDTWTGHVNTMTTDWFARQDGVDGGGPSNGRAIRFRVWVPQEADVDEETTATIKFRFEAQQWRPLS